MVPDPRASRLLAEFAQRIGLPDLAFNDEGFCAIAVDAETVDIRNDEASGHWLLFSDLGPPAAGEAIYLTLLQANLFWRATLGATLSLTDDEPPRVVLALAIEWRTLDAAGLEAIFTRFMHTLEDWRELLDRPVPEAVPHTVATDDRWRFQSGHIIKG